MAVRPTKHAAGVLAIPQHSPSAPGALVLFHFFTRIFQLHTIKLVDKTFAVAGMCSAKEASNSPCWLRTQFVHERAPAKEVVRMCKPQDSEDARGVGASPSYLARKYRRTIKLDEDQEKSSETIS